MVKPFPCKVYTGANQQSFVLLNSDWIFLMQLRVAGVQLLYSADIVGAALGFISELRHHKSRVLDKTVDAGDEPGRPRNLTERVLHSFARHDIPVDRPVSLPLVSVDMYCPGTQNYVCSVYLWSLSPVLSQEFLAWYNLAIHQSMLHAV